MPGAAAPFQSGEQGVEHFEAALLLTGKTLPVSSTFVATPSAAKIERVLHAESREGGVQESARQAVRGDDALVVRGVRDVAAACCWT